MHKNRKQESVGRSIARAFFGLGEDIAKAGFDLTVETPMRAIEETLKSDKRRK